MAKTVQIMPADNWFFVHQNVPGDSSPHGVTVYRLAAFALQDDGDTIGLVSPGPVLPRRPKGLGSTLQSAALASVPPVRGSYKYYHELTKDELAALGESGVMARLGYSSEPVPARNPALQPDAA